MAFEPKFFAVQSFVDDANRRTDVQVRTTAAGAQAWAAAADYAAAILTPPGLIFEAMEGLTLLKPVARYVRLGYEETDPSPNGNGGYRGNKVVIQYAGSGRQFVLSIPGRDMTALNLTGVQADIADDPGNAEMWDFINTLQTNGVDINGNALTVTGAYIND